MKTHTPPSRKPDAVDTNRRRCVALGVASMAGAGAWAAEAGLPVARSLATELDGALRQGQPLLVMVSLDGCVFCKAARQSYLAPLLREGHLVIVQVDMHHSRRVLHFTGEPATHDSLVRAWGVKMAPTVLFFGRGGVEVAERLTGSYVPDFYGAYLEDRLARAQARVRG